jgi:type IV pilus assembly protein PilX
MVSPSSRIRTPQRGAALVVGLLLLVVLTLLGVVGMNIANAELAIATNEQLRIRAFQAAETGIERALPELDLVGQSVVPRVAGGDIEGSPTNSLTGAATDRFASSTRYIDSTELVANNKANVISAFHYQVESAGTSSRGAESNHTQGAYIIVMNGSAPPQGSLPGGPDTFE